MKSIASSALSTVLVLVFLLSNSCTTDLPIPAEPSSPPNPLELLLEGNKRFEENHPIHPDQTLDRIRELRREQHPFAVVIGCSDSRLPPELIFDQGLGDLFVIRNAGNIISDYELGSVEYAVEHLGTKLIVVLGHKQCGAIGAFIDHSNHDVHNHIQCIIDYITSEPEEAALDSKISNYYEKAVIANVQHGVHVLEASEPILKQRIESGEVRVVGMSYDVETGKVAIVE